MNDILDRVAAIAPRVPLDPEGLASARRSLDKEVIEPDAPLLGDLWDLDRPHRPRSVRRGRRLVLVGAAAVVLAAVAVVAAPVWPTGTSPDAGVSPLGPLFVMPAAAADNPECMREALGGSPAIQTIGASKLQSLPQLAAASYLIGSEAPDHLRVRSDTYSCGQAFPRAIFYDPAGSGGISLYADVADPFTHETTGTVSTRGTDAHVLTPPAGHHFMTWTEPDGVRWFVVARGITVARLATWLDTAPLSGGTVGTDAFVPGMVRVPSIAPAPAGPSTVWTWTAEYTGVAASPVVDGYEDVPAGAVTLDVQIGAVEDRAASLSWALPGRILTTVDGAPASYVPKSEGGSVLAWTKDGATFRLYVGAHTLEASQAIAAQLEHVALGDPRVTNRLSP